MELLSLSSVASSDDRLRKSKQVEKAARNIQIGLSRHHISKMSSSRFLLRSMCDPYADLLDRAESYLASVEVWASKGNANILAEAVGAGKLAVVAGLAAKSLSTSTHPQSHFQQLSGLSPQAYRKALEAVAPALATRRKARDSAIPFTPRHEYSGRRGSALSSPSDGRDAVAAPSSASSAASLKERAMAVQSGAAFGRIGTSSGGSRPSTPRKDGSPINRSRGSPSSASGATASPRTPTQHHSTYTAAQLSGSRSGSGSHNGPMTPSRSVRFEPLQQTTSASRSQLEHPYTPSKRSRLGAGSRNDGSDSGDDDDDDDDEEKDDSYSTHASVEGRQLLLEATKESDGLVYQREVPLNSWLLPTPLFPLDSALDRAQRIADLRQAAGLVEIDGERPRKRRRPSQAEKEEERSQSIKMPWQASAPSAGKDTPSRSWWTTAGERGSTLQQAVDQWKPRWKAWLEADTTRKDHSGSRQGSASVIGTSVIGTESEVTAS